MDVSQIPPAWVAVIGICVGVVGKWVVDLFMEHSRRAREDTHRFIIDRRQAYSEHLSACTVVADVRERARDLHAELDELAASRSGATERYLDQLYAKLDKVDDAWEDAYRRLGATSAMIDLLAPADVINAAGRFASKAHRPHLYEPRLEAEREFVAAARADLGTTPLPPDMPLWPYEPYIDPPDFVRKSRGAPPAEGR